MVLGDPQLTSEMPLTPSSDQEAPPVGYVGTVLIALACAVVFVAAASLGLWWWWSSRPVDVVSVKTTEESVDATETVVASDNALSASERTKERKQDEASV